MKEQIINYIKEHKVTNFQEIFNNISPLSPEFTKGELRTILNEVEDEHVILSAFNQIYDVSNLKDHNGVIQWSMNGFCWVDNEDKSNNHGITFNIPDEAITIFNKKKALMGCASSGKIIHYNEKDYYFWLEQDRPKKNIEFIYYVDEDKKCWQLNNGQKMSIPVVEASDELHSVNTAIFDFETNLITHKTRLGLKSDKGIETKIAYELAQLKTAPTNDSKEDNSFSEIKDYTKKKFFTIDGLYTKDIDDAIALEETKTGYNLLVAIADVSHYVLPGTEIDKHASEVATSFYLNQKTVHMLDRETAEKKGSLNPGELKRTMVCKMSYDREGNLKRYKIFPAQILSHARLTYDDVNRMLNNEKPTESIFLEDKKFIRSIKNSLISLNQYRQLKPVNSNRSSIAYNRSEYVLNEEGKIDKLIEQPVATDADKIVEDAMLRANMCAAQHLYKHYPEIGLFRNQLIPANVSRPKAAKYGEINDGHWGLGADFYTHFTSPIRRYCDLIVHRMIKSIINGKDRVYSEEALKDISSTLNIQQNKSKQVQAKETHLLTQQYIEELFNSKKLGKTMTIMDITDTGIVAKNKQNIEYFIPHFKLSREVGDKVESITSDIEKKELIQDLNENYKILGFVDYFSWLDEKKNVSYFMQSKQQLIEKQKLKDAKKAEENNNLKM